jgi:hypothetical protein
VEELHSKQFASEGIKAGGNSNAKQRTLKRAWYSDIWQCVQKVWEEAAALRKMRIQKKACQGKQNGIAVAEVNRKRCERQQDEVENFFIN